MWLSTHCLVSFVSICCYFAISHGSDYPVQVRQILQWPQSISSVYSPSVQPKETPYNSGLNKTSLSSRDPQKLRNLNSVCPEDIGAQSIACGLCDGDDARKVEHCVYGLESGAQCKSQGSSLSILTTLTTSQSGSASKDGEDTQNCPVDSKKPECSNEKCASDKDNKCTTDHVGCACKPKEKEECPTYELIPECDDCGGAVSDDESICKGDPEENYLYKGCECSEFLAMQHRTIPHYTEEYARQKGLLWETAGSWKGNYSYDPNQDDEPCRKAS